MITPEDRDLARALIHAMEMQLAEPASPDRNLRTLGRNLRRSRLWPLHGEMPLAQCRQSDRGLRARIVRQVMDDLRDGTLDVTLRPSSDGERIHLAIADLPPGWRPICIVLGRFADWGSCDSAAAEDRVPQTTRRAPKTPPESGTGVGQPHAVPAALAADDGELHGDIRGDSSSPLSFSSSALQCHYHRSEALLEVAARLPPDQHLRYGVAELSYRDAEVMVCQRRPLAFRRIGDRWQASARLRPPAATEDGKIRLRVRPFTDGDLDLLPPGEVQEVLASCLFASLPLEPVADGFVFRPTMDHHRQAIEDPRACWCLRVAPVGKEGEGDE